MCAASDMIAMLHNKLQFQLGCQVEILLCCPLIEKAPGVDAAPACKVSPNDLEQHESES
jgi:hypothetical protein